MKCSDKEIVCTDDDDCKCENCYYCPDNRNCSNEKCCKELSFDDEENWNEQGMPSGYADDYVFCAECYKKAKKHFKIASYHSGGMMSEPACIGEDNQNKPHTCPFTVEEREEAMVAFKNYR